MSERDTAEGVRAIRKALGSPLTEIHDHTLAMLDRYAALLERAERPASDVERLVRDVREASHRHQAGETTSEVCDEAYAVALTAVRALAARPDVERAREALWDLIEAHDAWAASPDPERYRLFANALSHARTAMGPVRPSDHTAAEFDDEHARRMAAVERDRDEARREVERLRAAFFKGVGS